MAAQGFLRLRGAVEADADLQAMTPEEIDHGPVQESAIGLHAHGHRSGQSPRLFGCLLDQPGDKTRLAAGKLDMERARPGDGQGKSPLQGGALHVPPCHRIAMITVAAPQVAPGG